MKQIYLHIGFGKTGTSAVQEFFDNQRTYFRDKGLLYPNTGVSECAHHHLAPYKENEMPKGVRRLYEDLLLEIRACGANRVLLSSEAFVYLKRSVICELRHILNDFRVTIIVYLRNQVSLIESTYLQWQKAGWEYGKNIEEFFNRNRDGFDLLGLIGPWVEEFGRDNVVARVYDRRVIGEDTRTDMLRIFGLDVDSKILEKGGKVNQSLSALYSELIRIMDEFNIEGEARDSIVAELVRLSGMINSQPSFGLIGSQLREKIVGCYSEQNCELARLLLEEQDAKILLGDD